MVTETIQPGELLRHIQPGGGGWGDPMSRDPEAVRQDVLDGKVSAEAARDSYGVVLRPGSLEIDREATRQRREGIHEGRRRTRDGIHGVKRVIHEGARRTTKGH